MLRGQHVVRAETVLQIGPDKAPKVRMPKSGVPRFRLRGGQGIPALDDFHQKAPLHQLRPIRPRNIRPPDHFVRGLTAHPFQRGSKGLLDRRHKISFVLLKTLTLLL